MKKIYAGIGSRETPKDVLSAFENIGSQLANMNFTLRSGHADGADSAFESGCDLARGQKEIYLPWYGFNGSTSRFNRVPEKAFEMAGKYYSHWEKFKVGTQKLLARDCQQVLGNNLDDPVDFIICYTHEGKLLGGTAMALRLANDRGIKVFNAGSHLSIDAFMQELNAYIGEKCHEIA